jgi:MFS family permease
MHPANSSPKIGNPQPEELPKQIRNAYWFQGLNAASYQICLGSPLILFARELGAPAVVLGILAGLSPLTSVLQLVVARYAERIGYRNLMVRGWSSRVAVLIFLVALPFATPYVGAGVAVYALLAIMLVFTVSRATAVCSWMPWITSIVPKPLRGFYLSRDRMSIAVATLSALAISGTVLLGHSMLGYATIFCLSFLMGLASLYFLRRIPEPPARPAAPTEPAASEGVSWRTVIADRGFRRLILFSVSVQAAVASTGTFIVVFTREQIGIADGPILWLTAGASLIGLLALTLLRHSADRSGSKPFLVFVFFWWMLYFTLWFLLALNGIPPFVAPLLLLVAGFFNSTYDLSLTRLLMNVAGDRPASAQYFALHSVVASVVNGVAPIVWGLLLDNFKSIQFAVAGMTLNRYALLFGMQLLMLGLVALMLSRLKETNAQPVGRVAFDTFVRAPVRAFNSLMARRAR